MLKSWIKNHRPIKLNENRQEIKKQYMISPHSHPKKARSTSSKSIENHQKSPSTSAENHPKHLQMILTSKRQAALWQHHAATGPLSNING